VAQDVILTEVDCGTQAGIWFTRGGAHDVGEKLGERVIGRYAPGRWLIPRRAKC